jgi:hypothetical protein
LFVVYSFLLVQYAMCDHIGYALLPSLFAFSHYWVVMLVSSVEADIPQEVIELSPYVQVDLNRTFAQSPVQKRHGSGYAPSRYAGCMGRFCIVHDTGQASDSVGGVTPSQHRDRGARQSARAG